MDYTLQPFSPSELETLSKQYQSPFYIYDGYGIQQNAKHFMKYFRHYFPGFRNFFAIKATPNPSILNLLHDVGMSFDASSPTELWIMKKLDIRPQLIMYTSNYTSPVDIKEAVNYGCILNLDSLDSLDNMLESGCKIPDLISFRLNPMCGTTDSETDSNILGGVNSKFGIPPEDIINAYKQARDLGIKRFGLHCMTGSNILDITYWKTLIQEVFAIVARLDKIDIKLTFINLGGGIGIPYKPSDKAVNIGDLAQLMRNTFDTEIKRYQIDYEPTLYLECGRYITGPYGWLCTQCTSIKTVGDQIFYGVNASMANLMRPGMYNAYHQLSVFNKTPTRDYVTANVVGTLCENNDWFARNRIMSRVNKGDWVVFHQAGAHGHSMGFNYNGKLKCTEILRYKTNFSTIRYAETPKDLYRNCYDIIDYDSTLSMCKNYIIIILMIVLLWLYFVKNTYYILA